MLLSSKQYLIFINKFNNNTVIKEDKNTVNEGKFIPFPIVNHTPLI